MTAIDKRLQKKMPVLFLGHGSPMNALADNDYTKSLAKLAESLPTPRAILCVSAHWMTRGSFVTHMPQPKTIHDFFGFPQELFEVQYAAPGSPEFADLVAKEIVDPKIGEDDNQWGLDHGTWSVLRHIYPDAKIPVFQLSLDMTKPAEYHFNLGRKLRFLREQGVLIVGSGNVVHNLRTIEWNENATPLKWATEFDQWVKRKLERRDFTALVNEYADSDSGRLSVPTPDHYYPLLYILGAATADEDLHTIYEGIQNASISMRCVQFGGQVAKIRAWSPYTSDLFTGKSSFVKNSKRLVVLLHGVGANETDLQSVGERLAPEDSLLSLRAPITLGPDSYAWFHVRFTDQGPIHNGAEALASLEQLQKELHVLSESQNISMDKIVVFGFSQGAIMTLGLALDGDADLGAYIACSGRTLPEFAIRARKIGMLSPRRPILVAHGQQDLKLPIEMARQTKEIIESLNGNLTYQEHSHGHEIPDELLTDAGNWLAKKTEPR